MSVVERKAIEQQQAEKLRDLVMTNLGRIGNPVIRYRTGDLVQPSYEPCRCGRSWMVLKGGVLGRIDDIIKAKRFFKR